MQCLFCGKPTKVIDKRDSDDITRRRRHCTVCKKRFTTYERPEIHVTVIKKDGRRERYDRDKVLGGILKACEKRPVARDTIDAIVNEIDVRVLSMGHEVPSSAIGDLVMEKLKTLDKVAYIRFASVYREFDDINKFEKEVKILLKDR